MKKASNVKTIVESQAASASAAASSPMSKSSAIRALAALVLALCVGFMSGCSSNSYTPEPSEQKIDNSLLHTPGTLRVGVDASNAPYAAQSQGSIVGIDVDTAAALADELGLKLELVDVGTNAEGAFTSDNVDMLWVLAPMRRTVGSPSPISLLRSFCSPLKKARVFRCPLMCSWLLRRLLL